MNILFLGDISGKTGREAVHHHLYNLKEKYAVDFCIANGENMSGGSGITISSYEEMRRAGIDLFTGGNHIFRKKEVISLMNDSENVIRPANLSPSCPGMGYTIVPLSGGRRIAVINLLGKVYMDNTADNPFLAADNILKAIGERTKVIFVDFHAETTSEKGALARYLDGRVSAVIGTHTHVQTNDDQILPGGTAFLSDAGMTGAIHSILGVKPEIVIEKFVTGMPRRHEIAEGASQLCGVFLDIDDETGKARAIEKIRIQ